MGPVVSNDVFAVPVRSDIARIRVQCHECGTVTFRAEPDKGDADEAAALAAIDILKGYLVARGHFIRLYFRRHRNGTPGQYVDILDAVTVADMAADAERLLKDLQFIASSRLH